jgi:hypothetical protein
MLTERPSECQRKPEKDQFAEIANGPTNELRYNTSEKGPTKGTMQVDVL